MAGTFIVLPAFEKLKYFCKYRNLEVSKKTQSTHVN